MKHLSLFNALMALCVAAYGVAPTMARAQSTPGLDAYRYDLTPLSEAAPALSAALTALRAGEDLSESQAGLAAWLAIDREETDPWELDLARVLHARLDGALGRDRQAIEALEAHLARRSAHQDMARKSLAEFYGATEPTRRLAVLTGLTSGPMDHAEFILEALEDTPPKSAIPLLEEVLRRPWSAEGRRRVTQALVNVRERSGPKDTAIAALRVLWWRATLEKDQERWEERLASMGASPGFGDRVARLVLKAKRSGLRTVRRALKKMRPRSAHQRRIMIWGRAVLDRLEPHKRARAVRHMRKVSRRLGRSSFAPAFLYGEAAVLRKVGRDVEAAERYESLAAEYPDHGLATDAWVQAGGLRMWVAQPEAASRCYQAAADRVDHGRAHREGLWHAALAAFLVGNHADARVRLDQLVTQYGAVADGVGGNWLERGLYWGARAAAEMGDDGVAAEGYRAVVRRFPTGWYAMLARAQLKAAGRSPESEEPQRVSWSASLDAPVLALRMRQVEGAVHHLDALMRADRLAGKGRWLLAWGLGELGRAEKATSVHIRHGLPMTRPQPSEMEAYGALYGMPYRALVEGAATAGAIPVTLLAGLIHVESRYQAQAKSGAGAMGLCQLLPTTARVVGRRLMGRRITSRSLRDPETNINLGARFLGALLTHFQGHPVLALAGYNAGRGAARSWLRARGHLPTDLFVETMPYDQARRYVKRVLAVGESYRRLHGLADEALTVPLALPTVLAPYVLEEPPPPTEETQSPESEGPSSQGAEAATPDTTPEDAAAESADGQETR